ncbi:MAG: hypothetical protein SW833_27510 [Cyanobacteriota bacterium]|nr:hypothetical protein [Cyanobacteriota bacterium]
MIFASTFATRRPSDRGMGWLLLSRAKGAIGLKRRSSKGYSVAIAGTNAIADKFQLRGGREIAETRILSF